jgi:hypothetical protein
MLKFTFKGSFLTIEKAYEKLLYYKSKWIYKSKVVLHTLVPPLRTQLKKKNSKS